MSFSAAFFKSCPCQILAGMLKQLAICIALSFNQMQRFQQLPVLDHNVIITIGTLILTDTVRTVRTDDIAFGYESDLLLRLCAKIRHDCGHIRAEISAVTESPIKLRA